MILTIVLLSIFGYIVTALIISAAVTAKYSKECPCVKLNRTQCKDKTQIYNHHALSSFIPVIWPVGLPLFFSIVGLTKLHDLLFNLFYKGSK